MSASAHSDVGLSGAYRFIPCLGSVALIASLPKQESGPAAREGTKAHAWAEYALKNGEVSVLDYVGAECPDPALAEFTPLTREMAEAVDVHLDYVYSILSPEDELYVEHRLSFEFIANGVFSTADVSIYKPKTFHLHIVDYKHGAGKYVEVDGVTTYTAEDGERIDIEGNTQLKGYGLGALKFFTDRGCRVDKVTVSIVQPRCGDGAPRHITFSPIDLWEFGAILREAVTRARAPGAPRCPGEHCGFCPGTRGACLEFKNKALAVATDSFGSIIPPDAIAKRDSRDLIDRWNQLPYLEKFISAFKSYIEDEVNAGRLDGFKYVQGSGKRAWAFSDEAIVSAIEFLTGEDIQEPVKALTAPKVEKLIGKKRFAELADLVTKKYSKPKLVLESDPRPALSLEEVKGIGADAFETIEAPE